MNFTNLHLKSGAVVLWVMGGGVEGGAWPVWGADFGGQEKVEQALWAALAQRSIVSYAVAPLLEMFDVTLSAISLRRRGIIRCLLCSPYQRPIAELGQLVQPGRRYIEAALAPGPKRFGGHAPSAAPVSARS